MKKKCGKKQKQTKKTKTEKNKGDRSYKCKKVRAINDFVVHLS